MATSVSWFGGDGSNEIVPAESGLNDTLGFFGSNFGFSIQVGAYNNTTFVTRDDGSFNHGQCPNLRWANTSGAFVASELIATELLEIQDDEATIRIRLTTDSAVQTQNAAFRAFDRVSIANAPSGVTIRAAEVSNGDIITRGSGDVSWTAIAGTGALSLDGSGGGAWNPIATQHDFFVALTVTPTSIGEKTSVGFYFETEFL